MAGTDHPTIGCCGIDCGLCPRYYTEGTSKCPGCAGEGFNLKHPSCGFVTCCVKERELEVCAECKDFPCKRFDKETGEHDSFVLHRRVMHNQNKIKEIGLNAFLAQQSERIDFLEQALAKYNDGRSKSFYCIAATLLSISSLKEALNRAEDGERLRDILNEYAQVENQILKLNK